MKAQMNNISYWRSLESLTDEELTAMYINRLKESGFDICGEIDKKFTPYGFTTLILLSESHFAIHTFPEHNTYYAELSSCVDTPFFNFIKTL